MALWNQGSPEGNSEKPVPPAPTPSPAATVAAVTSMPTATPTPVPTPRESTSAGRRESVFGPGVTIEGKIEGDADAALAAKADRVAEWNRILAA